MIGARRKGSHSAWLHVCQNKPKVSKVRIAASLGYSAEKGKSGTPMVFHILIWVQIVECAQFANVCQIADLAVLLAAWGSISITRCNRKVKGEAGKGWIQLHPVPGHFSPASEASGTDFHSKQQRQVPLRCPHRLCCTMYVGGAGRGHWTGQ